MTMFELQIDRRLSLRQRQPEDAAEMFALTDANRADLREWMPWLDGCTSAEATRRSIQSTLRHAEEGVGLAAAIREDGRIVGVVSFNEIHRSNRTGHLGYWLGAAHRGRGIATAACRALMQYGFDTLGLNRIVLAAATGNTRSRALAARLGLRLEGAAREAEWLYDRFVDHAVYAITRSEWPPADRGSSAPFPKGGWPAPQPRTLEGRFITLTPLDLDRDVDALFAASHGSDAARAVWRYTSCGPFADDDAMRDWLRAWQATPDAIPFTVTQRDTGRRIGSISLMRITPAHGVAELGFIWFTPDRQRTQANTEANYLLLRHCFADLGYRRMEWKCDDANERSKRAALRLGYRYEGTFQQHLVVKGANRDTAWFAMLDRDWPCAGSAMERWLYTGDATPLAQARTLPAASAKQSEE